MRIQHPKDVCDAIDACQPYMTYREGEGVVPKEDAPQEIKDLYKKTIEKMHELEEEWRRENW